MLDNYTLIDGKNVLPKTGDIICKEYIYSDDVLYCEDDFIESLPCEVLSISRIDNHTGYPTFKTKQIPSGIIYNNHRIIGSTFGDYYIVCDKSKRNRNINSLLND